MGQPAPDRFHGSIALQHQQSQGGIGHLADIHAVHQQVARR